MPWLRRRLGRPPVPRSPRHHGAKAISSANGPGAQTGVPRVEKADVAPSCNLPPMAPRQSQTLQIEDLAATGVRNSVKVSTQCDRAVLRHPSNDKRPTSTPGTPKIIRVNMPPKSARVLNRPEPPKLSPPLLTPLTGADSPRSQKSVHTTGTRRPKTVPANEKAVPFELGCISSSRKPPQTAPATLGSARSRVMTLLKDMELDVQESPRSTNISLNELYHDRFRKFLKGYAGSTLHGLCPANVRETGRGDSEDRSGLPVDAGCCAAEEQRYWQEFWDRLRQQEESAGEVCSKPRNLNIIFGKTAHQMNQTGQTRINETDPLSPSSVSGSSRKGVPKQQASEDGNKGHTGAAEPMGATSGIKTAQSEITSAAANKKELLRMVEACTSLRSLVFGNMDNVKNKDLVEQRCGTREEVEQLQKVWSDMDEDGSGDVEFKEFLSFFSKTSADKLSGMRCVNYLMSRAKDQGVDENEMGCTIQDMMHLIWLKATPSDIRTMMKWFHTAEYNRQRVQTPDLLPDRKRRAIMQNFPDLHWDDRGFIFFQDLIACGTIDSVTMTGLQEQLQISPFNHLSGEDVIEVFCPNGYRAHAEARTCVDKKGNQLVYVDKQFFKGWMLASALEALEDRHGSLDF